MEFLLHEYDDPQLQQQLQQQPQLQPQPAVGILTVHDDDRPFRGNAANFIDLIRAGREFGVPVYVITAKNLKLAHRRVNGYVYDAESKTWNEQPLPLPRVIYNRVPTRKHELRPEVQQVIQACLKHSQIRIFNPSFFNKVTLFEWLIKSKTTRQFIPATKRLSGPHELEALLQRHSCLYLKPASGKAGKGIMRVEKASGRWKRPYRLSIQSTRKSETSNYPKLMDIWNAIHKLTGPEEYIVQQGITLTSYNNRPFDLRVLVQKNYKGQWSLTGVGARVAGKLSITTHVPRGGSIDEPEKLLTSAFGTEPARRIMQKVKQTAFAVARQIEKASGHRLGEMSMDLGVDTTGHIWFFEANSRPMKFDEPDIRKRSLERIIQYSQYLMKSRKK